jgi:hypothetical protein
MHHNLNKQNAERETDILRMRATPIGQKRTLPIYKKPWPVVMNNYFAPYRDLCMETVEPIGEGSSATVSEANHSLDKGRPSPHTVNIGGQLNKPQKNTRKNNEQGIILLENYIRNLNQN